MDLDDDSKRLRTHTFSWEDPAKGTRRSDAGGLDYLTAIKEGKIPQPPAAKLVGYKIVSVAEGRTVFELDPKEYHYNPFGTMHGGIASTILDSAMTSAVLSTLAPGVHCSTIEFKVNFIQPITRKSGLLRCEGRVIHRGKTLATAEGRLTNGRDKLFAHGTNTCRIFVIRDETPQIE